MEKKLGIVGYVKVALRKITQFDWENYGLWLVMLVMMMLGQIDAGKSGEPGVFVAAGIVFFSIVLLLIYGEKKDWTRMTK